MRLLYKPFAIIAGLISARVGKSIFEAVWSRVDDQPPPTPSTPDAALGKIVGAKALQGATMAAVAAAVDRAFAKSFFHLFGAWPAKPPEKETAPARSEQG